MTDTVTLQGEASSEVPVQDAPQAPAAEAAPKAPEAAPAQPASDAKESARRERRRIQQAREARRKWMMSNIVEENPVKNTTPVICRRITLCTHSAYRQFINNFQMVDDTLFYVGVIMRIIGNPVVNKETDEEIDRLFSSYEETIGKNIEKLEAGIAKYRIDPDEQMHYDAMHELKVTLRSPKTARFMKLFVHLDKFNQYIDALWMNGRISDDKRMEQLQTWSRDLGNIGRALVRIRRESTERAANLGKAQEVKDAGVTIDADEAVAKVVGANPAPQSAEPAQTAEAKAE